MITVIKIQKKRQRAEREGKGGKGSEVQDRKYLRRFSRNFETFQSDFYSPSQLTIERKISSQGECLDESKKEERI